MDSGCSYWSIPKDDKTALILTLESGHAVKAVVRITNFGPGPVMFSNSKDGVGGNIPGVLLPRNSGIVAGTNIFVVAAQKNQGEGYSVVDKAEQQINGSFECIATYPG